MKKLLLFFSLSFCFMLFSSFSYSENNNQPFSIKTYKFTFSKEDQFKVSFADYPKGEEDFYELQFAEDAQLPAEITTTSRSLKISGNNHSDDLFMYAYKKLEGLKANTKYQVHFSVEFASNGAADSIGTGGSASSVYVKLGAVAEKPQRYLDEANFYRMALDKGNQLSDGKDMILLGSIGVDSQSAVYRIKTLSNLSSHYSATTNSKGELWLVLGTDSAFESKTTIYYTNIIATFKEINSD
ncbi:hypothetical protein Lnau_1384 [Legionella nautarum]|uniref:Uncharacterized protein n=1 Tax=Legionella nautarum TaxID=45070 RepID=A0A0W0WVQ4_9GAMM|nr:hypothetical protein [Legionella nautarum]KTD36400.1 hypothetical protein Lnau_1384 [Legionella nautarum]